MPAILRIVLPQVTAAIKKAADSVTFNTALDIRERVEDEFMQAKHGRIYQQGKLAAQGGGSGTHQASAPGEAPAILTGTLDQSYKAERIAPMRAVTFSDDPKAPGLEFGTGRVAARPHLTPAVESLAQQFYRDMSEAVFEAAAAEDIAKHGFGS